MQLSWNSISAGAMTAAVSLGSSLQAIGASAGAVAQAAVPAVTAGGMQAVSQGAAQAASQAAQAAAALPQAIPQAVHAGAASTAKLASDLALVEKPAKAMAAGIPRSSMALRTAGVLSRALPVLAIGASTLSGAQIVNDRGAQALLTSKEGRGAVLGTMGGALLLMPHPATQLAAAGVLGAVAVNQFGGLERLDRSPPDAARGAAQLPAAT